MVYLITLLNAGFMRERTMKKIAPSKPMLLHHVHHVHPALDTR